MTKYEHIKSMSLEEMTDFFEKTSNEGSCRFCAYLFKNCGSVTCKQGIKEFLESEVSEND